jgi:hypothetical protein
MPMQPDERPRPGDDDRLLAPRLPRPWLAAALSALALSGCAEMFLAGSHVAEAPPPAPLAQYEVSRCVLPVGAEIEITPRLRYYLAYEPAERGGRLSLYELPADGGVGTVTANGWPVGTDDHFFLHVHGSHGFEFVLPAERSAPGERRIFVSGSYEVDDLGGDRLRPRGPVGATCPMVPLGPGPIASPPAPGVAPARDARPCGRDVDCPGEEVCELGRCVALAPVAPAPVAPAPAPTPCRTDMDCPGDELCEAGRCRLPALTVTPPAAAAPAGGPDEPPPRREDDSLPAERWRFGEGLVLHYAGIETERTDACRGCRRNQPVRGGLSLFATFPAVERYLLVGPELGLAFGETAEGGRIEALVDLGVVVRGRLPFVGDRLELTLTLPVGLAFSSDTGTSTWAIGWYAGVRVGAGYAFVPSFGLGFELGFVHHDLYQDADRRTRYYRDEGTLHVSAWHRF